MGAFGLLDDHHHERVPVERLAENYPCVSVHWLYREGLLVVGASARLETAHGGYQMATREPGKIWIGDQVVVIGSHPVLKLSVFICPTCQNTRYKLFEVAGRWACYRCHGLTHASRHAHRTIPNYHRLMRLRRKISADPRPFTPIPPMPSRQRRYWRIVREIRQLEAGLVRHIREHVADVLERRDGRQSRP